LIELISVTLLYRWLIKSFIAYLLADWIDNGALPPVLVGKQSDLRLIIGSDICLWFKTA